MKTVVRNGEVVEAHWQIKANETMWKVNIDGGGIGEWSEIPREAIDLSERLADELGVTWMNLDIIRSDGEYIVTEFSAVNISSASRGRPDLCIQRHDYNINIPLDISLDLERMVVESLIETATSDRSQETS